MADQRSVGLVLGEALVAAGIDFVVSVPEFNFKDLLLFADEAPTLTHVPVTREEEGIGICVGAYLGGRKPVMLMQNAGLLNSCNALATTALQFEVPVFMVVWHAGDVRDTAFMRLGEVTEGVLTGLGIRYLKPRSLAELPENVAVARQLSEYAKRPVALLVTRYPAAVPV